MIFIGEKTKLLKLAVDNVNILGQEHFPEIKGKQVVYFPNHLSHLDYVLLGYNFVKHNLPYPVFVAGKNIDCGFPVDLVLRFGKWGAWYVDRDKIQNGTGQEKKDNAREIRGSIEDIFNQEYPFLVFAEGGRDRSGKVMSTMKTGVISSIHTISKSRELYGVPIAVDYDKVVEKEYFERLDAAKKKGGKLGQAEYYFWDFWAFASRIFKKKGDAYLNFGAPFKIDFPDRKQFTEYVQQGVRQLYSEIPKKK